MWYYDYLSTPFRLVLNFVVDIDNGNLSFPLLTSSTTGDTLAFREPYFFMPKKLRRFFSLCSLPSSLGGGAPLLAAGGGTGAAAGG